MLFHGAIETEFDALSEFLFSGEVGNILNLRTTPFNGSDLDVWPTFCKFKVD